MSITPLVCYFTKTLDSDVREPVLAIASLVLSLSILVFLWYLYRFLKSIEERIWAKKHNLKFQYFREINPIGESASNIISGIYRGRKIETYIYFNSILETDTYSMSIIKIDNRQIYPIDKNDKKVINKNNILKIYDHCIDNNTYEVPKFLLVDYSKMRVISIVLILLAFLLFLYAHSVIFTYLKSIICI
ncbi:MAG: hypothetical protein WC668_03155 [Patescibacteria group bacterium]|jgi:hypothetical protein